MTTRPLVLLVATLVVAGCAGGERGGETPRPTQTPDVPLDWAAKALPFGSGHGHADPLQHQDLSTPNFEVLGWDPLETGYHGANSGGYYCGDVGAKAGQRIAVTHSFSSDVALIVIDVTDPAKPTKLGELAIPRIHVYDVAMFPDASFAVLATNPARATPTAEAGASVPIRTDACGRTTSLDQEPVPYSSSVVLVDLANPQQPRVVDSVAQPAIGPHSVFATLIDGKRFVLAATTNLVHQVSYFTFFTVDAVPAVGPRLTQYGVFDAQYPAPPAGTPPLSNGHVDGWIQKHPTTKEVLAYLANWNGGLIIVRLEGPGQVRQVANWNDYDTSKGKEMTGQIHDALPIEGTWDGKHYTFIGQEIVTRPANRPTGQVILLDTTDPARPTPKARWTLPVDVEWSNASDQLIFSTHYIELVNQTLFVSLYHGGVWAVDARPEKGPELPTLGVFVPDRIAPKVRAGAQADPAPEVLDVLALENGDLVSYDGRGGVYVYRFTDTGDVPVPAPWTKDAWIRL
ncbi:MAG: hypothetical protein HYT80_03270 [Euryarchaeota archaeon]|nr:hypothetical protein [Euryarchaeota archaeon]